MVIDDYVGEKRQRDSVWERGVNPAWYLEFVGRKRQCHGGCVFILCSNEGAKTCKFDHDRDNSRLYQNDRANTPDKEAGQTSLRTTTLRALLYNIQSRIACN
jgi:hypothetical protein